MAETTKTRPVSWIKSALRDFEAFPDQARSICLTALTVAAEGARTDIAKPLHGLGSACLKLPCIRTPKREIDLVRDRLKRLEEALR